MGNIFDIAKKLNINKKYIIPFGYDKAKISLKINDELKGQGFGKVLLNLSEIDDDEDIIIDYENMSFSYKLPFTINIEETGKQIKDKIINESENKIELENITINQNGLISGNNNETYEDALDAFMEILSKLRRNI